jgi:tetratricopeptide (TPR) repeat protein
MLVAVVDLPFADQIRRVRRDVAEGAAQAIARWAAGPLAVFGERRGRTLLAITGGEPRDLADALARLDAMRRDLDAAGVREHVSLVFEAGGRAAGALDPEVERLLGRLEAERPAEPGEVDPAWLDEVVVHSSAAAVVGAAVELEGSGEFLALRGGWPERGSERPEERPRTAAQVVARPNVSNRIVEAAFESLEQSENRPPVLVSGRDGVGKSRAVRDASLAIMGKAQAGARVTVHTLFGRKSAIHPFLNSIRADLLAEVPAHLSPWEARLWPGAARLLRALGAGAAGDSAEAEEPGSCCPDRLSVDFYGAYRLYLVAYTRAMEARCVPALAVFEDIHTYHPEALRFTVSLVRDLLRTSSFLPILTCRDDHEACASFGADVLAVPVHAVTLEEIRGIAGSMFPGLGLPERAARKIRSLAGGRLAGVEHYLRHLARAGKIGEVEGSFAWVPGSPVSLPADGVRAAWEEIAALGRLERGLLFLCALCGGILPVSELLDLSVSLDRSGSDTRAPDALLAERQNALRELARSALVRDADLPVFLFPPLAGRLEQSLEDWAVRARRAFSQRLEADWRSRRARHLVLTFSALRGDRMDVALDILGDLVTRKLDELNVRGCRFFLDPARLRVDDGATEAQRDRYLRLSAMGELRSQLLLGAWERAEKAMDRVANMEIPEDRLQEVAQRSLEQARFHLAKADSRAAVEAAKSAAIRYHDAGEERGERRAQAELGAALLADGRLEESLEYFGFVFRSAACDPFPRIRAASLAAVASYLRGNLSEAIRLTEEGARIAEAAGRREWQALMLFFRARQHFDLGELDQAVAGFEGLLAFTRLYDMERARAVVTAWIGRSLAYAGRGALAGGLLEALRDSAEVRFFRAEALYLLGQVRPALQLLESPDLTRRRPGMQPGERVSWEHGFASIEERCTLLRKDGGTLAGLIRGFRAYLGALDGRAEQASRELYRITRVEHVADIDPYLPLYGYWYAASLPEGGEGGEASEHRLTVLNRAMMLLQQRSSRIEVARHRWQLMKGNYWNAKLLAEARARRLV